MDLTSDSPIALRALSNWNESVWVWVHARSFVHALGSISLGFWNWVIIHMQPIGEFDEVISNAADAGKLREISVGKSGAKTIESILRPWFLCSVHDRIEVQPQRNKVQGNDQSMAQCRKTRQWQRHRQMDRRASLGYPGVHTKAERELAATTATTKRWLFLRKYSAEEKHEISRDSLNKPSHGDIPAYPDSIMEIIISKRGKRMEKSQLDGLVWRWLDFLPRFNLLRFNLGCRGRETSTLARQIPSDL